LKNIACEKPGSTNNTIIISAHYDSRMEDINNSTARAPGANDNASGVSALLEVARILSDVSLNHSIIFVLFSGEEQGKWGSTYYADYIDKTDVDLDLLINLDMVGFSSFVQDRRPCDCNSAITLVAMADNKSKEVGSID
ncbi:MAG: M28 family metallopeptidase, partial [Nitrososphaeraceae archaeon]